MRVHERYAVHLLVPSDPRLTVCGRVGYGLAGHPRPAATRDKWDQCQYKCPSCEYWREAAEGTK